MKKLFILISTLVIAVSCFIFTKPASAEPIFSAFVIEGGFGHPHHRYPDWHRHYYRHPCCRHPHYYRPYYRPHYRPWYY